MIKKYSDIIDLPRPNSKRRPQMPVENRAAQFAPFAALTGHEEAVKETARLTEKRIELDQYMKDELNRRLQILIQDIRNQPKVRISYFQGDEKKEGGRYIKLIGRVKKIDPYRRIILMEDNKIIPMEDIIELSLKISNL